MNFNDKLILTGWNWIEQVVGMKNPEERSCSSVQSRSCVVAAEFSGVQEDRCWPWATNVLIAATCFVCFEPKAVKNRPRVDVTFAKDDAVRGAVVEVKTAEWRQDVLNLTCLVELGDEPFANPSAFPLGRSLVC